MSECIFFEEKIHNSSQNKSYFKWFPPNNEFLKSTSWFKKRFIMQMGHFLVEYLAHFPCFCFHI